MSKRRRKKTEDELVTDTPVEEVSDEAVEEIQPIEIWKSLR